MFGLSSLRKSEATERRFGSVKAPSAHGSVDLDSPSRGAKYDARVHAHRLQRQSDSETTTEAGESIYGGLCRESSLRRSVRASFGVRCRQWPNLSLGRRKRGKDQRLYIQGVWAIEVRPSRAAVAPCDRRSQRIDGRPRPRSGRRGGLARLARRRRARAGSPNGPADE
jgi:hypothetical protein